MYILTSSESYQVLFSPQGEKQTRNTGGHIKYKGIIYRKVVYDVPAKMY